MASEESGESTVAISLPEDLQVWLDDTADRRGVDRDALVRELIAAHKALDGENGNGPESLGQFDPGVTEEELEAETQDLRTEFMDLLEDVRKRVIQVKRETDAKAPADHDHEELARLDDLTASIQGLEAAVDDLESDLSAVESDLETGFDNYEEILEFVLDSIDDLEARTETIARATIQSRKRLHEVVAAHQRRAAVDELKRAANQYGIETAACSNCGTSVRLSLLTAPECPHCAETVSELEPKSGLFGKPTLETGEPPALAGSAASELDQKLESHVEDAEGSDSVDAADVDWKQHAQNDDFE